MATSYDDCAAVLYECAATRPLNISPACGGGPAIAVMKAAKALGATDGRVLEYAHSGDVSGDNAAVVGYLAAGFGTFADAE